MTEEAIFELSGAVLALNKTLTKHGLGPLLGIALDEKSISSLKFAKLEGLIDGSFYETRLCGVLIIHADLNKADYSLYPA